MTKVYAIANQKGGVGKTTMARVIISILAAILVALAQKKKLEEEKKTGVVVGVDMDPQGHYTLSFQIDVGTLKHVYHVLVEDDMVIGNVLLKHSASEIYIAPTNIDLAAFQIDIINNLLSQDIDQSKVLEVIKLLQGQSTDYTGMEGTLVHHLQELEQHQRFDVSKVVGILKAKMAHLIGQVDYIIIDCPPSLDFLTLNALVAADGVIIPCETKYVSYHGLYLLHQTIEQVRQAYNPDLKVMGIIPTRHDARSPHDKEILAEMRANYPETLIDIPIPIRTSMADVIHQGSVTETNPTSDVAKIQVKIVEEILRREKDEAYHG